MSFLHDVARAGQVMMQAAPEEFEARRLLAPYSCVGLGIGIGIGQHGPCATRVAALDDLPAASKPFGTSILRIRCLRCGSRPLCGSPARLSGCPRNATDVASHTRDLALRAQSVGRSPARHQSSMMATHCRLTTARCAGSAFMRWSSSALRGSCSTKIASNA